MKWLYTMKSVVKHMKSLINSLKRKFPGVILLMLSVTWKGRRSISFSQTIMLQITTYYPYWTTCKPLCVALTSIVTFARMRLCYASSDSSITCAHRCRCHRNCASLLNHSLLLISIAINLPMLLNSSRWGVEKKWQSRVFLLSSIGREREEGEREKR